MSATPTALAIVSFFGGGQDKFVLRADERGGGNVVAQGPRSGAVLFFDETDTLPLSLANTAIGDAPAYIVDVRRGGTAELHRPPEPRNTPFAIINRSPSAVVQPFEAGKRYVPQGQGNHSNTITDVSSFDWSMWGPIFAGIGALFLVLFVVFVVLFARQRRSLAAKANLKEESFPDL